MKLQHIMLVEDDPDIREILTHALEKLGGFKVTACDNGENALEKIAAKLPQLILLDVMMPGMDGKNALKLMRQQPGARKIPIIFLTARTEPKDIETYRQMGALGTIGKPVNVATLHEQILALWNP